MAMLEVKNLEVYYGVICALKGISFEVNQGEIVSLIGANGAGKTTTMQSVVGLIPKKAGTVTFNGQDITKTPCHKIVHLGMTQVPEGRRIFQELTVYENLLMGAYGEKNKQQFKNDLEAIYTRFPRLAERRNQIAGTLSGGEQQMLAMGRAVMCHPKLLMLDEPSMGLSPLLVDQVFEIIKDINRDGTTVLLVEQNAGKSLAISDRAYVMENGSIVLSGTGAELAASEQVRKAYLGGSIKYQNRSGVFRGGFLLETLAAEDRGMVYYIPQNLTGGIPTSATVYFSRTITPDKVLELYRLAGK